MTMWLFLSIPNGFCRMFWLSFLMPCGWRNTVNIYMVENITPFSTGPLCLGFNALWFQSWNLTVSLVEQCLGSVTMECHFPLSMTSLVRFSSFLYFGVLSPPFLHKWALPLSAWVNKQVASADGNYHCCLFLNQWGSLVRCKEGQSQMHALYCLETGQDVTHLHFKIGLIKEVTILWVLSCLLRVKWLEWGSAFVLEPGLLYLVGHS